MKHVLEECKRKQGTRRVGVANHLLQAETQLKRKHQSQREKKKNNQTQKSHTKKTPTDPEKQNSKLKSTFAFSSFLIFY